MEIRHFSQLKSTNQKAKELARKGAEPWTIILADSQNRGYGKEKAVWFSPQGGLYFSIILPKSNLSDLQTLTILSAFIVAKTIKENFALEPMIKLPNDILINGKKAAGILTENVIGKTVKLSVLGIGLNTNIERFPKELKNKATSLKIELGKEINNEKILKQIVKGIKEQLTVISE